MSRRVVTRSRTNRQRGNTILGLIIGVVLGLGIAAAVALFVTKATVPFVSKQARVSSPLIVDPDGKLPDPNRSLYSKDALPTAPSASSAATTTPTSSA